MSKDSVGKIVAIGGGEIGRPGYPIETTKIDKEIIALTGKKSPRFLFVPTASGDAEGYIDAVRTHFGKRLGLVVDVLCLTQGLSQSLIEKKVLAADIIYVGGGNTEKMMRVWRKIGFDDMLRKAYERGVVLSGLSAGSICWFSAGHSDSRRMIDKKNDYIRVSGLGFINALHCPHWNVEQARETSLKKMMKTSPGVAIVIDNCAALEVVGDTYRLITSKPGAGAYRLFWSRGKYHRLPIPKVKTFRPLSEITRKT